MRIRKMMQTRRGRGVWPGQGQVSATVITTDPSQHHNICLYISISYSLQRGVLSGSDRPAQSDGHVPPPHWVSLQHNRACEHIPCVDGDGLVHHKQHLLPVGGAARHGGGVTGAPPGPDSGLLQGRHSPGRARLLDAAQIPGQGRGGGSPWRPWEIGVLRAHGQTQDPRMVPIPQPLQGSTRPHNLAQPVSTPSHPALSLSH